jgi:hypothetical protein
VALPAPQTDAQRLAPYREIIAQAAAEADLSPAILAAVGLRETWLGWSPGYYPRGTHLGWGDQGHAWGLWQADVRSWKSWILSPDSMTVLGQARQAALELAANLRVLRTALPSQPGDLLLRAAVAGYNARLGAVAAKLLSGQDVDGPTTGGDYSADVMRRAEALRKAGLLP